MMAETGRRPLTQMAAGFVASSRARVMSSSKRPQLPAIGARLAGIAAARNTLLVGRRGDGIRALWYSGLDRALMLSAYELKRTAYSTYHLLLMRQCLESGTIYASVMEEGQTLGKAPRRGVEDDARHGDRDGTPGQGTPG